MAQPQLIDRYLAALQDNLGRAPDAGDILAEVEDHLRETATRYRHDGLDPHGAEARALEAFGSPRLVARAFADASGTKGLAMPTIFTRRAGLAAIASPLVLLAAMPALFADEWITGRTTGWYFAGNNAILIALALLMVAMVGMRARHGGALGTLGLAGLILTGLGTAVVLAQFSLGAHPLAGPYQHRRRPVRRGHRPRPGAVPCRGHPVRNRTAADRGTRPSLPSVHPRRRRPHMAIRSHVAIQPHRDRRLRPGPDLARLATPKRAPGRHQPGDGTGHLAAAASRTRVAGPHRAWAGPPESPQVDHHRSIHLAIGPGGVIAIDSKQYRGRLQLDPSGRLWHGRCPLTPTLQAVSFEADQAAVVLPDPGMAVVPIVAIHGAQVPWGKVVTQGVPVVSARRRALPAVLGPERVAVLANQARVRFHAAL